MTTPGITRRSLLATAAAAPLLTTIGPAATPSAIAAPAPTATEDDYLALLTRWHKYLTGGPDLELSDPAVATRITQLDEQVAGHLATWSDPGTAPYLWPDLDFVGSNNEKSIDMRNSFERLESIATAYATSGSTYHGDAAVAAKIVAGLRWLNTEKYSQGAEFETASWYQWEIGSSKSLANSCVLLGAQLTAADVTAFLASIDRWSPDPTRFVFEDKPTTGANRIWKCMLVAVRGIVGRDSAKLTAARDGLSDVFPYVVDGDGFYLDGSLIQHGEFPYNGAYGASLVQTLAPLLALLTGSPWQATDPQQANVFAWIYDSFEPFMVRGAIMDMVRGRVISNPEFDDHVAGHVVIDFVLRLSEAAPAADAAVFRSMVKHWITSDEFLDFFGSVSLDLIPLARSIVADDAVVPRRPVPAYNQYAGMDRAVQWEQDQAVGIAMSSARIRNFESTNLIENLRGWYTANGMTYQYTDDLGHYADGYWPTVDPYRLPGTTVDPMPRGDSQGRNYLSPEHFVGGVELQERYGISVMALKQQLCTLRAQKAWFCFGEQVVALGSGIDSTDPRIIETIVENRKLPSGATALVVDDRTQPAGALAKDFADARWAHVDGVAGYYFPTRARLHAIREARTGKWSDINTRFPDSVPLTRWYATLWFDHGTAPTDGAYAYVLLPGASRRQTARYAARPGIHVVANTRAVQAVRAPALGLFGVVAWQGGARAGGIESDQPATILTRRTGQVLTVAVADPAQRPDAVITVDLAVAARRVLSADPRITVLQSRPTVRLRVDTEGTAGRSLTARLLLR